MCNGKWEKIFQAVLDVLALAGRFWIALGAWWKEKKTRRLIRRSLAHKKPSLPKKRNSPRGKRGRKK